MQESLPTEQQRKRFAEVIPPKFDVRGASMDHELSRPRGVFQRHHGLPIVFVLLSLLHHVGPVSADDASQLEFFEQRIRPVLIEHCYSCHSAEAKGLKGGLFVDSAAGLTLGGDSGPAIEPGDSESSLLIQALRYEAMEMPPQGKLPATVIADFERWVDAGAHDPRVADQPLAKPTIDVAASRDFWSFVPPEKPTAPTVSNSQWPTSPIDHFVLAKLEAEGLTPVAPADKRSLLRRATFDLTGLPPTPAEVEHFLADSSPQAFEKVVDRLLRSPAYGERWGRYWLDIARYAEDQAHTFSVMPNTNGYRYRDWVIAAFNADMPYDLFVKRQIAADLLAASEQERLQHLPALGYFGLGAQYYKNSDAAKAAADELDDRVDTLTRGFLGLTVSCARCHDHKYDPIPQQDYYSLAGIFRSSKLHNAPLVPQTEVQAYQQTQQEINKLEEAIAATIAAEGPRVREAGVQQIAQYLTAAWQTKRSAALKLGRNRDEVAAEHGLDAKTLARWIEFLENRETSAIASLGPWFEVFQATVKSERPQASPDPLDVPVEVRAAAEEFQQFTALLLRQRDSELTPEEQQILSKYDHSGDALFRSRPVTKTEPAVDINVDIAGATELYLVVTDGGNGNRCDHADWAEPVLIDSSGERLPLTKIKWRETKTTYGNVNLDRNVNGGPLRIGGTSYASGIGTHATSLIAYDLPSDVRSFHAIGGLDNSGSDQGGDCGANAKIQFHVYTKRPQDLELNQPDLLDKLFGEKRVFAIPSEELEKHLPASQATRLAEQRNALQKLRDHAPEPYPIAHVIAEASPADMHVFIRGNPANQGEIAPRRFLRILSQEEPTAFTEGSGRLELAEAIASADNPLTARVMVNRIWQHHFGHGIVGTPDNFGALGEQPTHPELLDYLAQRFVETGWSVKALHREIMLSSTYRLSTESNQANMNIDADNRYLWRMNRRRLEIEAWRDALLAVSGKLDQRLEGPSTKLADKDNSRRTVYAFISRHELNNMLRLFDFPDANITASTRAETTVPQQQLFVLNSPFVIEQAKAFADRVCDEAGEDIEARVRYAFLLAYGRPVSEQELLLAKQYLSVAGEPNDNDGNQLTRWQRYAQVLLAANEFMYLD